ncbi:unnamed protein product, partial [Cylicocyclus nassatus]
HPIATQYYREAISELLLEIGQFLESQERHQSTMDDVIEALTLDRANTDEMTRKKSSAKKANAEAIVADAGDTVQELSGIDDSSQLQQQISQLREYSSRLETEYNEKLDELRKENDELRKTIRDSTSLLQDLSPAGNDGSLLTEEKQTEELLNQINTSNAELIQLRENHKEALDLICSLKVEVSDLKEKVCDRDRIIEEAKGHLRSLEEISEQVDRRLLIEAVTQTSTPVSSSVEEITVNAQSDDKTVNTEEQQLVGELTSLAATGHEIEDPDVPETSTELCDRCADLEAELTQVRTAYNCSLAELASTQRDNDELTKAQDILQEQNETLLEKIEQLKRRINEIEETERKRIMEYEELSKSFEAERSRMIQEREELCEKLEDSTHKADFLEVDQAEKRQLCENLATQCEELERELEEEKERYSKSVELINSEMETLRYGYGSTLESLEKANFRIDELESALSFKTKEHQTANDQGELLERRIVELEETVKSTEEDLEATRSAFATQMGENHRLKAELALLEQKNSDTREEPHDLQMRLDAVELELIQRKEQIEMLESKNKQQGHKNIELQSKISSLSEQILTLEVAIRDSENALVDAQAESALEIEELKSKLSKSNAAVDTLLAQLEVASRNVPVEEVEKQLRDVQVTAENAKFTVDELVEENERLSNDLAQVKQSLSAAEQKLTNSSKDKEKIEEKNRMLLTELEAVRKSEDSLSKELWTMKEEQLARDSSREELDRKTESLCNEVNGLKLKVTEMEAREFGLMKELTAARESERSWHEQEQELKAARLEKNELRQKFTHLEQAYKDLQERLATTEFEFHNAQERVSTLEADLEERETVASEAEQLRKELLSKEKRLDALNDRVHLLEEELLEAKISSDKLNESIEELTNAVTDRDSAIAGYETELAVLRTELAKHRERVNVTHVQSSVELKRSEETISHLRDDNVRLEKELFLAHEQLECTRSELGAMRQSLEHGESLAMATRNENQRLVEELQRAVFEREQTFIMAGEGREAAARVIALERSIAQLKGEHDEKMEQVLSDLEASEQRVHALSDSAEQARLQYDDAVRKMEFYRERFELAAQEIESLARANEEVRHLEAALEQNRAEKAKLYEELTNSQSYIDRIVTEKDALLAQLTALNGQLDERTNRLRQAGEAKMDTTLRIVELESQVASLLREREQSAEHNPDIPSSSGVNQTPPVEHVAVQIESMEQSHAEISQLRTDLQRAERRIAELEEFEEIVGDDPNLLKSRPPHSSDHSENAESAHFVSASTPFPSLVTLLSRRFGILRGKTDDTASIFN